MAGRAKAPGRADIVIAGAGIAGLVLARALATAAGAGFDVVLLGEPSTGDGRGDGRFRAIALSRGAVAMLDTLGIWGPVEGEARAMERIVVTDGRPGGTQLSLLEFADGERDGASAHVIDESALARAALAAVRGSGDVRLADDVVTGVEPGASGVAVSLGDGGRIAADLVVAADGARSTLRRLLGIRTVGWDYGQSGIVTTVKHEKDHGGVAVERFLPAGPFAILPLTGRRSGIVWTEGAAEARRLMATDAGAFREALALRFGPERGRIGRIGPRAAFPLAFHVARRFIGPRAALIGDAAHAVHPLAGQGLNLGLRDAAALAEAVVETARLGLDPGGAPALERYERWRRFDTISSALAYDGLNRLFANDHDPVRLVRDLGLGLVDRLPAAKRVFMREAAGIAGDVPRLMAGEAI